MIDSRATGLSGYAIISVVSVGNREMKMVS
ncbi:Uncharacterised protein [Mycobacteroides abscessus subsp. abscessus]|nr:Uncharacterised protein [Mycobacteroides abscessus subsp. abscessus]